MKKFLVLYLIIITFIACSKTTEAVNLMKTQRANVLLKDKKYEQAKKLYLEAVEPPSGIDSVTLKQVHLLIGDIYEKQDSIALAEKHFLLSKEIDTTAWHAWYYLGNLYDSKKEFVKAEKHYKKAIELDPENSMLLGASAVFYMDMQDYDTALVLINKCIAIDSLNEDAPFIKRRIMAKIKMR